MYYGGVMMGDYITIVGCSHYHGIKAFKVGQIVRLVKDYDNDYDDEAIRAEIENLGKAGYVANSTHTVARGTNSGGRIYDTFEGEIFAIVKFVVNESVICELIRENEIKIELLITSEETKISI